MAREKSCSEIVSSREENTCVFVSVRANNKKGGGVPRPLTKQEE